MEKTSSNNQIKLVEGVIFNNFRVHAIFNDKTSIIIHPGGQCFTYFHKNGEKVQKILKFVTMQDCMKEKLLLAIHFHNMFGDFPIIKFKQMFVKRQLKTKSIKELRWREDSVKYQQNVYSITSTDQSATVSLSPSLFLIRVVYLGQFEQKVTRWINQKQSKQDQGTMMFTTKPMASNSQPQTCFQFGQIKSVFSICQYPSRWSIPLYLLWSRLLQDKRQVGVIDQVRQPNFPKLILSFFQRKEKNFNQTESFKSKNFAYIQGSDQFITFLQNQKYFKEKLELKPQGGMRQNYYMADSVLCKGLKNSYTTIRASFQQNQKATNATMKQFWNDDSIIPRENFAMGGYMKSNFYLHWSDQATIRQVSDGIDRQIQIHMHFDDSIILGNGDVFQHWILNQYQASDDRIQNRLRFFTSQSIPIVSKNPRIKGQVYYNFNDLDNTIYKRVQDYLVNTLNSTGTRQITVYKDQIFLNLSSNNKINVRIHYHLPNYLFYASLETLESVTSQLTATGTQKQCSTILVSLE